MSLRSVVTSPNLICHVVLQGKRKEPTTGRKNEKFVQRVEEEEEYLRNDSSVGCRRRDSKH